MSSQQPSLRSLLQHPFGAPTGRLTPPPPAAAAQQQNIEALPLTYPGALHWSHHLFHRVGGVIVRGRTGEMDEVVDYLGSTQRFLAKLAALRQRVQDQERAFTLQVMEQKIQVLQQAILDLVPQARQLTRMA
jgi:hypothetical protein